MMSSNNAPSMLPQEKDITPDPQLLDKVNDCSSQLDFMRLHSQPVSQLPSDLSDIFDFFIALTVCNTVVVSSPNQPRQKVRTFYTCQLCNRCLLDRRRHRINVSKAQSRLDRNQVLID